MGLISAALGAASSVLADQWKEYFYCDSLANNVMAVKGQKKVSGKSSNRGTDNIISNGSVIAVAEGQCMLIVEQGKIVELCAEPGEFVYDTSTEPSIFTGKLGKSLLETFKNIGKRFTFGGQPANDQRVYYFNTKEMIGNKYGTANPVPFRVVDTNAHIDMDIGIRCFGEYSYHICDPMLFFTNVCGNITSQYTRDQLDSQLKTELLTALQPAFAKISDMGIRYSSLVAHTTEMADSLNEVLSKKWRELRGIEVVSFGISSLSANEEDEKLIKELQKAAAFKDPTMGAAYTVSSQGAAIQAAASNTAGAAVGLMGYNMVQGAAGNSAASLYAAGQQAAPAADGWTCSCGQVNTGNFCTNCGTKKPAPAGSWTCSCGQVNTGNFCTNCGTKKPASGAWTCDCGQENTGNFCTNCGKARP